jgi:uncharacterized protein YcfJ
MNKLILAIVAATALTAGAAPAFAYYDEGEEYARVVSTQPIYQPVQVAVPRQECHDQRVVYQEPVYRGNPGGTLLGALVGGVVGHQFGGGNGRAVATAAGALIGAEVGAGPGPHYGYVEHESYQPSCTTYTDYRTEDHVTGYDVNYEYHGRVYHTRMPYDPGNHIRVHVAVNPVQEY